MLLLAKEIRDNTSFQPLFIGLTGGGKLEEKLKEENISYRILNFDVGAYHKNYRNKIIQIIKISRALRNDNISIIITRTYYPNIVGLIAAFLAGIKYRYWFQVSIEWKKNHSKIDKYAIKCANRFLANSEEAAGYIVNVYGVKRENIGILPNSYYEREIQHPETYWREKLNIQAQEIIIGLLSNFFPVKDHITAIKAFSILSRKYKNLKMVLAGYAPEECNLFKLKALAFDLNLTDKVIFTESTHDVQGILKIIDICLFTSLLEHTEGSPNIILDYMLAGKPIVASKIGPVQEIFNPLNQQYMYEPENVDDLTQKLDLFIENSS